MFARKAKAWKVDRALIAAQALPANSNDNDINGRMQGTQARRALVCRWRGNTTTGKPECHWEIEGDTPFSARRRSRGGNGSDGGLR
jgi:hypothetical protein